MYRVHASRDKEIHCREMHLSILSIDVWGPRAGIIYNFFKKLEAGAVKNLIFFPKHRLRLGVLTWPLENCCCRPGFSAVVATLPGPS